MAVAWAWDGLVAGGRALAGFIPWARFKQSFALLVDRLPAPLVLLIFLVPFLIVEPLVDGDCFVRYGDGLCRFRRNCVDRAEVFLSIAVIPAIFDLTKHRLMTMPWFVRAYEKVMAFHHYADAIVAPYKQAAAVICRQWRMRAAIVTRRVPGLAHLAAASPPASAPISSRPAMPSGG